MVSRRALTIMLIACGAWGWAEGPAAPTTSFWHAQDLAAPPRAAETSAVIQLGRRLFYDPILSINGGRACATCHEQAKGFTDGFPRAVGTLQHRHPRNTLALVNLGDRDLLTWDNATAQSLSDQMLTPLFGTEPVEMGMDEATLLQRLAADPGYPALFADAFGSSGAPPTTDLATRALAAFERTLVSNDSPFDRYRRGHTEALSATAERGMKLFFGELRCDRCHGGRDLDRPTGADRRVLGQPTYHNVGLYNLDGAGAYPVGGQGLIERSGLTADMGKFRTPTLRNVEVTGPYMNDGTVYSLKTAISIHTDGGRNVTQGPDRGDGRASPLRDPALAERIIDADDMQALIVFLHSLTDDEFLTRPELSNPL